MKTRPSRRDRHDRHENPFATFRRMSREARTAGRPLAVGDLVAAIAAPAAERVDARLGTGLAAGCGGCDATRRALNGGGALEGDEAPRVI